MGRTTTSTHTVVCDADKTTTVTNSPDPVPKGWFDFAAAAGQMPLTICPSCSKNGIVVYVNNQGVWTVRAPANMEPAEDAWTDDEPVESPPAEEPAT